MLSGSLPIVLHLPCLQEIVVDRNGAEQWRPGCSRKGDLNTILSMYIPMMS